MRKFEVRKWGWFARIVFWAQERRGGKGERRGVDFLREKKEGVKKEEGF